VLYLLGKKETQERILNWLDVSTADVQQSHDVDVVVDTQPTIFVLLFSVTVLHFSDFNV